MQMRSLMLAPLAAMMLAPIPALAGERAKDRDMGGGEVMRQLQDPRTQDAVGNAMGTLIGALLGMPAEPFVNAAEQMGDRKVRRSVPKGATLGDLAGPDARAMPRQIKRQVPHMMNAAGSMVGLLEQMAPQLEELGKKLEADLGDLD
jgi:hypothetical protein